MITVSGVEAALDAYAHASQDASKSLRWAGVTAVLRDDPARGAEVLIIQRSEHPNDPWSGHMALPGGRQDDTDATVRAAAEREALEEVGVDLAADGRLLGRLDDVMAVSRLKHVGLVVAPFVYALERPVSVHPNEEVQAAMWVPLSALASDAHKTTLPYVWEGTKLLVPGWEWDGRVIWGLTWKMLDRLIRIVHVSTA